MNNIVKMAAAACAALLGAGASAQAAELVVAHIGPFSGPLAVNGLANYDGGKTCVDEANASGGIRGRKLRLVRADDEYKPDATVRLLRNVAQRDKPVAFINLLGSANLSAVLKDRTLEDIQVPVVGVTPGADVLRASGNPWLFHVHASDNAQLARILMHIATIGLRRVAVAYQDIPFGQNGIAFIREAAPKAGIDVVGGVPVPSAADDLSAVVLQLRGTGAQAYIMILVPNSGSSFVAQMRKAEDSTPIYGMSYVQVNAIMEKAGGAHAAGIRLAQVTPNPDSERSALVRKFRAAMAQHAPKGTPHTQLHLIGYLSCRVLLEGLKVAGDDPTPVRLKAALHSVRADLGDYYVEFEGRNEGSRYVDIGVINRQGRLQY